MLEQLTLESAKWGSCCECIVSRVRPAGVSWPLHQSLIIECPGKTTKIDFYYKHRPGSSSPEGGIVTVNDGLSEAGPSAKPDWWSVQEQLTVDCEAARALIENARSDKANPPNYNWLFDCHWYNRCLVEFARQGFLSANDHPVCTLPQRPARDDDYIRD